MNIAFIAHDSKKKLMENLCIAYRHILIKHNLFATGTTGSIIEESSGLHVTKYLSGKLGGEYQLGAQIADNNIDLVIFLRDPLRERSYEPDINSVLRLCDMHNIPLASNLSTAEKLLLSLKKESEDIKKNLDTE
ncbi:MAG: methylglyoxal synthase [Defluviitaleaceae bacterium]|nr:methylglyoxal synthase [Defluviitaleaceae bacterium]